MYRALKSEIKTSQRECFEVEELITHQVRTPSVIFRSRHHTGTDRVEVDVGTHHSGRIAILD